MPVIDVHIHHSGFDDPEMDGYLRHMDEFEVAAALVHALPVTDWTDNGRGNEDVLRAVRKHPGRLSGSVYIDLNAPPEENIETVKRFAGEGFKCVKMFPNLGFDPNDDCHEPVWEAIEEQGLMCLSHCGWLAMLPRRIQSITASPSHFEVPARRHPKINFIFAHFGGGATYLETVVLTSRLKNAYADVCPGWGRWVFENRMPGLGSVPFSQVLYGTDSAGARYGQSVAWWRRTLEDMGRSADEIEAFFYGNAARLLGLEASD